MSPNSVGYVKYKLQLEKFSKKVVEINFFFCKNNLILKSEENLKHGKLRELSIKIGKL